MTSWKVFRARAALALANLMAIAGFMAVMPLVLRTFVPGAEAAPLLALAAGLPGGLTPAVAALAGLAVMLIGRAIGARQSRLLKEERRRREDARRRLKAYRGDERIEPTLGPGTSAPPESLD